MVDMGEDFIDEGDALQQLSPQEEAEMSALGQEIRGIYARNGGSMMPSDPLRDVMQSDREKALNRAIESLPPLNREAVKLRMTNKPNTNENMSFDDVGAAMGITRQTAIYHYDRGLGMLRERLRRAGHGGDMSEYR